MKKNFLHIIFFALVFNTTGLTQQNSDEFNDFLEELDAIIEENNNEQASDDDYDYYDYESPKQQEAQEEYLKTPIEKKRFNREKWNDLRRQAIEEAMGEGGRYEEGESPYGDQKYSQRDNPYEQEQKSYRRYWSEERDNSKQVKTRPKEIKNRPARRNNPVNDAMNFQISPAVSYILIGLIIAILAGLIFYLFYKNPPSKETKVIPKDIEEVNPIEIPKSELELRLEEAIRNQDYRKAIRIYFIFIIRGLSERKWIAWEKEKTNFAYLNEMRQNNLYQAFDESVILYEIVWYGKRKVDVDTYKKLEPTFKSLIQKIEK